MLIEFKTIIPLTFESYEQVIVKAANERYFEKVVESLLDLSFLVIKIKKYGMPEDDFDAFKILFEKKIINKELLMNLKLAKGMRNLIVHQYGDVDDELVYNTITKQILLDAQMFLSCIKDNN